MSTQITGISSMATRQMLTELVETYEQRSGQQVDDRIGRRRGRCPARRGRRTVRYRRARSRGDRPAGRSGACRSWQPGRSGAFGRGDRGGSRGAATGIGNEAAVRDAILAARSIGYSTGPSGAHLTRLFERWGIAETIASRIVQAPPGVPVGALIARGEVELGFQQLSELMHLPGIDVIGALPPEIQVVTVFSAAACSACRQPDAARSLLAFLASPEADAAKRRQGMEPA